MENDENEETGLGGLVMLILTAGAFLGIHLATRKTPYERKLEETATLITQEAARLRKPVNPAHVELALRRFNEPQLELFHRYVKAVIHRDIPAWEAMQRIKAANLQLAQALPDHGELLRRLHAR